MSTEEVRRLKKKEREREVGLSLIPADSIENHLRNSLPPICSYILNCEVVSECARRRDSTFRDPCRSIHEIRSVLQLAVPVGKTKVDIELQHVSRLQETNFKDVSLTSESSLELPSNF